MTWLPLLLFAVLPASTDSWPAFLGAGAPPISPASLPLEWSATDNVAWRADLPGHGQSSPVIWGGRVFTTSVVGPSKETYYTTCIDLASGRQLWQQSLPNSTPVTNSYYVSRAAPTPVVDDKRIIALFESGDCVAYSHEGKELWRRPLGQQEGPLEAEFGLGASPCQNATQVFVLLEVTRDGPTWTAQRKWVAEGAMPSWASPIVHQGLAYWINRAGVVYCFDASSGEKVFAKRTKQPCWATPIAVDDRLYLFGQQGMVTVLAAGREFKVLAENPSWTDDTLPSEPALPEEESEERRRAAAMFSKPTLYGAAVAQGTIVLRVGNCLIAIRE